MQWLWLFLLFFFLVGASFFVANRVLQPSPSDYIQQDIQEQVQREPLPDYRGRTAEEYERYQEPSFVDKDCSDFITQSQAQQFFISEGGLSFDPHKLDGDNDGIACEWLP